MLRDLSLRYKIPLRIALLVLLVATVVTGSLLLSAYEVFRDDLRVSSANMGRILGRSLTPALLHDDTWKAFEIINTPFSLDTEQDALQARTVIVLNRERQIYVSTQPIEYPMLTGIDSTDEELSMLNEKLLNRSALEQQIVENADLANLYVVTPIKSDGVLLGTLVMGYSHDIFTAHFTTFAWRAAMTTLLIIAFLLPIANFWGRRFAVPLVELANCMSRVGNEPVEHLECQLVEIRGHDEMAQLNRQFRLMLEELRDKADLERQFIIAERLAAIGRFTAGIAHEINNPLGGMLNATNTLRRHGNMDPLTEKTVQLLERGLLQIKDTVSALLVEAKETTHPLSREDIEDIRSLVTVEASHKSVHLDWHNGLHDTLDIPSTLVRQVMLNLLLNAIKATGDAGQVECRVEIVNAALRIHVNNTGQQISDETLAHLFEPFSTGEERGRGLGLWVTYQIVTGLEGTIEVDSGIDDTRFSVVLPLVLQQAA